MIIPPGQHFWAKMHGKLLIIMKDLDGDYFVCGGWEMPVSESEFNFISSIEMPEGYGISDLYYL